MSKNINRQKVHELTGLKNGLEFLLKRLLKKSEFDAGVYVSFSKAVERYALIIHSGYEKEEQSFLQAGDSYQLATGLEKVSNDLKRVNSVDDLDRLTYDLNHAINRLGVMIEYFS